MPKWIRDFFTAMNWDFTGSDIIQILLSVAGFIFAYIQLDRTKKSIDAAKEATDKTNKTIQNKFSMIESTEIANGIKSLKDHINSEKYDIAQYLISDISIKLMQLSKREEFINNDKRKFEIDIMILYISNLEQLLIDHEKNQKNFDLMKTNGRLSEIVRDIYGWIEVGKFQQGVNDGQ